MRISTQLFSIVILLSLVSACSEKPSVRQITEVRVVSEESGKTLPPVSTAARMGIEVMEPASSQSGTEENNSPVNADITQKPKSNDISLLRWAVPEAWHKGEDKPMRLATYIVNDIPDAECVVSVLTGEAGGIMPNLNRWRGQFGLPPVGEQDQAQLLSFKLLGSNAVFMECSGGIVSEEKATDSEYMLLGVICPLIEYTLFIKMTGPAQQIKGEKENFMAFVNSMSFEEPVAQ
ncbi:MAG TPA: hypothetical protein PLC40_07635 [Candidatus Hydrogenedentes bacterium]|nr:hypothetical protein [Candidatus Hydrogenedentota bacterium]